jgi:hypothetical protein
LVVFFLIEATSNSRLCPANVGQTSAARTATPAKRFIDVSPDDLSMWAPGL